MKLLKVVYFTILINLNDLINNTRFNEKTLKLNIEQVSNHTYLKGNKLNSPIIKNYDLLENTIGINLKSDDLELSSNITVLKT